MDHNLGDVDCECDDERPRKTQQRLNSICFPTLQSITGRTILANMETIPVQTLPFSLWQLLLEQLKNVNSRYLKREFQMMKQFEDEPRYKKTFAYFDLLVGPRCTEFCVDWLLVLCPGKNKGDKASCLSEVLRILARKALNLEKLTIGNREYDFKRRLFGGDELEQLNPFGGFGEHLLALGNLRSLNLDKNLQPEELILIGSHLQKLELFKFRWIMYHSMNDLEQATLEMMGNLKSLRHFNYVGVCEIVESEMDEPLLLERRHFGIFCLKNFPQLQSIGRDSDLPLYHEGQLQLPSDPNLTKITVDTTRGWLKSLISDPFLLLPNISELAVKMLFESQEELSSLSDQLSKLMHFAGLRKLDLNFMKPPPEVFRLFFSSYGRKLTKLKLFMISCSNVQALQELSELCPVLEDLHLVVCSADQAFPMLASPGSLASLKTLHLNYYLYSSQYSVEIMLLAAPNLQKLTLVVEELTQAEVERLSILLKSQQICAQLQSFTVLVSPEDEARFTAMSQLTKDMCAYCPMLEHVHYRVVDLHSDDYSHIAAELKKCMDCCLRKCLKPLDDVQFNK